MAGAPEPPRPSRPSSWWGRLLGGIGSRASVPDLRSASMPELPSRPPAPQLPALQLPAPQQPLAQPASASLRSSPLGSPGLHRQPPHTPQSATAGSPGSGRHPRLRTTRSVGQLSERIMSFSHSHSAELLHGRTYAEKCLLVEYAGLAEHAPLGVHMLPIEGALTLWNGVIFIHDGPFSGATFRFVVETDDVYPSKIPTLRFTAPPFHPLIDPLTGELDTSPAFPVWKPDSMFIWQILDFMKKALVHGDDPDLLTAQPDLDLIEQQLQQQHLQAVQRGGLGAVAGFARPVRRSHRKLPRNDDALALLRLDKDAYRKRAADSAAASNQYLYEDPDSDIKFSPWNLDIHQTGLNIILNAPNAKVAVDRFLSFLSADPDVASTMSPYSMVDADGRHNSDGDGGDEYDQDNGNVSDDRDSFGFPIDEHTFDPLMLTDDDDDTGNGGDGGVNSADPTSTMTSNGGRNSRNSYFGGHLQDTAVAVRDYSHMFGRADPDPDPESDASTEIIEIDDRGWHKTWTEDDEDRFAESTRYSWHPSSFNSNNRES